MLGDLQEASAGAETDVSTKSSPDLSSTSNSRMTLTEEPALSRQVQLVSPGFSRLSALRGTGLRIELLALSALGFRGFRGLLRITRGTAL
jgi:hypothetical protein